MRKLNVSVLIVASAAFAATLGQAAARRGPRRAPFERLCAERGGPTHHPEMADRLAEYLDLTDAQKAAFKEFHEARKKSLEDSKAALCASKPDLSSFEGPSRLQPVLSLKCGSTALKAENPKLIAFYNSLGRQARRRSSTGSANAAAAKGKEHDTFSPIRLCAYSRARGVVCNDRRASTLI